MGKAPELTGGRHGRNLTFGLQERLGLAIVNGDYRDQPFPTEGELVRQLGVSRSVTREAVKMLAAKGLLAARPKFGTYVLPEDQWNLFDTDVLRWLLEERSSLELLRHFNELRIAIEPQAAALAALNSTAEQRAGIAAGLDRMVAAKKGEDDPLESDIAFHVAILRASGNPFFHQLREAIATALRTSIQFTNRITGHGASIADHSAVLAAIEKGDPEGAHRAMKHLIQDVLELIGAAVQQPTG